MEPISRKPLLTPRGSGDRRPILVCFPYAGGGASTFRRWSTLLEPCVQLQAYELPGRGLRAAEQPLEDFFEMVVTAAEELLPGLSGRYAVFGHSMGALVAFEVARYLAREYGLTPEWLFASACAAPGSLPRFPPASRLPDWALMEEMNRRYGGIPEDAFDGPELWTGMVTALRADLRAVESYRTGPSTLLHCPVTTLRGRDDHAVPAGDVDAWAQHTRGPVAHHLLEGGHFFVNESWRTVAGLVKKALTGSPSAG